MQENNNKEKQFIDIIEETVKPTQDKLSEEKLKEKLSDIMKEKTSVSLEDAKQIVDDVSSTIELISDSFKSLKKAKEKGQSGTEWLKEQFDRTLKEYHLKNTEKFIDEIKEALRNSNNKIAIEIFGTELDFSEPLTSTKYDDINKIAIINDFQNEIKNNTLLGSIIFENGKIEIDENHKELKIVKDYFEAELDSYLDRSFKKAVSVATIIGQKKTLLPPVVADKLPEEIAVIVDRGLTNSKLSYKIGKGELSPVDAVEYIIDRNVSILNSVITTTCTQIGGVTGGRIGAVIGSVFGPAGMITGNKIGTTVGKVAGYNVGKFISEGTKKVADVTKSVCRKTWDTVKSGAKSIIKSVASFFS